MADFIDVNIATITSWTSGRNKPQGLQLLRLRFFLEAYNYDVEELRGLHGTCNHMLAEMLVYGILTYKQAIKELGFNDEGAIYRIAYGGSTTSPERAKLIQEIHELYNEEIETAKNKLSQILGKTNTAEIVSFPQHNLSLSDQDEISDSFIASLAHLVQAITPLLEKAVTNTTTEQRNLLRKLAGDGGMFRLSKASSKLCSEKAREIV